MLIFCKEKHLKVILVTTPAWGSFRKFANADRIKQTTNYLKSLTVSHEIAYANYWDDKRFTVNNFGDTDHLNNNGAAKFTEILDKEFITPLLKSLAISY